MVAAIATPRRRKRLPDPRQLSLPFRADDPPPEVDGPELIGAIVARLLHGWGLTGPVLVSEGDEAFCQFPLPVA